MQGMEWGVYLSHANIARLSGAVLGKHVVICSVFLHFKISTLTQVLTRDR